MSVIVAMLFAWQPICNASINTADQYFQMANSWDNRIKFLVRYMYDLDNNGYLNKNDFDCLAVKFTIMEGKGEWNKKR